MNNKFLRMARELARLFCSESQSDLETAKSNLETRLNGQRLRVRQLTLDRIKLLCPEVALDD